MKIMINYINPASVVFCLWGWWDGIRLSHMDFTEYNVWPQNYPWIVTMPDSIHRIYVAGLIETDSSDLHWSIVSARWNPTK